jgi:hypothetical protein
VLQQPFAPLLQFGGEDASARLGAVFHHLLVRRTVGLLGDEAPRAYLVMQQGRMLEFVRL